MKKNMFLAAVCCMVLAMVFSACTRKDLPVLRYRFASQEEGRQLRLANTAYFDALTQNDIDWKLQNTGTTKEEYKEIAAAQIQDFSEEEKQALGKVMDFIEARMMELGFRVPMDEEIVFVKNGMRDEGMMGGYTYKNVVFLSADEVRFAPRIFQADPEFDADYLEYGLHFIRGLVTHEIFHCLTSNDAQFRRLMYGLIGFTIEDREREFGSTVRDLLLHNPDVEHYDNWAEFTIDGQKRRCTLLCVYPGTYAEAAAANPEAHFFDDMHIVLVPIDDPDTMIPIEEATDFYDVMGHNTDYLLAAEECAADNFSYLISYGFFGHYDLELEKRIVEFIPYETPQLIRRLHETLMEYYPRN